MIVRKEQKKTTKINNIEKNPEPTRITPATELPLFYGNVRLCMWIPVFLASLQSTEKTLLCGARAQPRAWKGSWHLASQGKLRKVPSVTVNEK